MLPLLPARASQSNRERHGRYRVPSDPQAHGQSLRPQGHIREPRRLGPPPDLHRNRDPPRRGQPQRGQMPRHVRPQRRNPGSAGVHGSGLAGRYAHRERAPALRSSTPDPRRTRLLAPAAHRSSRHQAVEPLAQHEEPSQDRRLRGLENLGPDHGPV